jgi:hypothetical protein
MMPTKCKELVAALAENMWTFQVIHNKDTGNGPFVSVEARRDNDHLMMTWHTRGTGTYRLFSCMANKRDLTLTKAMEKVAA